MPSTDTPVVVPKDDEGRLVSRRVFVQSSCGALLGLAFSGCGNSPTDGQQSDPRLTARPGTPTIEPTLGLSPLGLGGSRDGVLYIPEGYSADTPAPLFVALHGAGGDGSDWVANTDWLESRGMILLAPDSRSSTWDRIRGTFGPDVDFIDRALRYAFERCRVDPTRLALAGFSDGASYALALGISNGDLFSHLIAYSPGSLRPADPLVGEPAIFISHGTGDQVLPVSVTRDQIVPALRSAGYDVTYREFSGGHEIPAGIAESSLDWFLGAG